MINLIQEPTAFYPAFNDCYLIFNTTFNQDDKAVINITNTPYNFTIYPNLDGEYLFNLKHIVSTLINSNKFRDNVDTSGEGWVFKDASFYKEIEVEISAYGDGGSDNVIKLYSFTRGVKQFGEKNFQNNYQLLLPSDDGINFYVRYFEGWQFDLPFRYLYDGDSIQFYNKRTELTTPSFLVPENSPYRVVLDKGNTSWNSTGYLEIPDMLNQIDLIKKGSAKTTIDIRKEAGRCGVYLKWLNAEGGYSYWLFNQEYKESNEGSEIDRMGTNNFSNIFDNLQGNTAITGKEGGRTMELKTSGIKEEIRHLKSLITSPLVQMFSEFTPYSIGDWIDVKVTTKSLDYISKKTRNQVTIDIELPNVKTQKY